MQAISLYTPVTIHRSFKKQHWFLRVFELAAESSQLSSHAAEAGVGLEGERPALRLLIHHLQNIAATFLRRC